MAGVSGHLLDRLQYILNAAARLVFSARRSERIALLLRDLHWLRVPERIQLRLLRSGIPMCQWINGAISR